jgi:hypothetical protein
VSSDATPATCIHDAFAVEVSAKRPNNQQIVEARGLLDPTHTLADAGHVFNRRVAPSLITGHWLGRVLLFALGVGVVAFGLDCAAHSIDFPIYHRIAQQVWQGDYALYPAAVYGHGSAPAHGFRYAPAIAFMLVPLGWLPLEVSALIFFAIKVFALFYIGTVVARRVGLSTRSQSLILFAVVCVGGYLVEELRYGNVHLLVIALMVYAVDTEASDDVAAPAVALGVAIATKLTPVLLLAYFLMRRRFAVCVATVGVLVALAFLPAMVVGLNVNTRLLEGFARYAGEKVDEGDNYALRGVLAEHLAASHDNAQTAPTADREQTITLAWLVIVVAGGLIVAILLREPPSGPILAMLDFSIVLTAMLLASPHTQRRYLVALYVPALLLTAILPQTRDKTDRRLMMLGLAAVLATGTVLPLLFGGRHLALWYEAGSPYFFGTLAMFVTLLVLRVRLQKQTAAQRHTPSPRPTIERRAR